jgi:DNA helicase-2/ATP-dependent DNA helicase PcrA
LAATRSITEGLNPQQRAAVEHADGPLLVLARAGSGKTRMLTHRIAHLIASGAARPWEILAVTFTNKAANEMRRRVEGLLGASAEGIWVSTFHSSCVRILRREIEHLGYERSFGIYDDADSLAAIKRVLRSLGLPERVFPPRAVRSQIDRFKNRGLLPADVAADVSMGAERIGDIYQRYQTELRRANALDFGDLLVLTVRLFRNRPKVLEYYQRRWHYLLVDEYQDTNPVQYELLRQLAAEHGNLCVVGDEDQSIYGFREADIRNILDFEKDFPGADVVRLERNYRSSQAILDAATAVVENNQERKGKKLVAHRTGGDPLRFYEAADERAEAAYVVGEMLALREAGRSLGKVALFDRTHAQSRPFEEELLKYDLPYVVVGGTRFYDRAEVKDALAYLRVLRNPDDTESLLRIINRPARGIGRTTIERLLEVAHEADVSLWRACERALEIDALPKAASRRVGAFVELMAELREHDTGASVGDSLARALDRSGYVRMLEADGSIEAEARLDNLRELAAAAEEFERQNPETTFEDPDDPRTLLDLFLEQVTLLSAADRAEESTEKVALMTVHVAKGLEFPVVFVVGLEEGLFPHFASLNDPSALEEERRLCYVAMTRAEDRLYLTNATLRRTFGQVRYNPPSRFLDEIPSELIPERARPPREGLPAREGRLARSLDDWSSSGTSETLTRRAREAAGPSRSRASRGDADRTPRVDYNEGQWDGDELPPLEPGVRVEHPILGAGTISEIVGAGRMTKIRVRFDHAGLKTIVLRYAQLRLIG